MRRRMLGWMVVLMLLVGAGAACGDDSDDGGDDGGGSDSGNTDSGDSGGGGNADVQAFCESVQEYVDAAEALAADPTDADAQQTFTDLGAQLGQQATELTSSELSAADREDFEACQTDFSSAG